jgi:hypothetical protein
VGGAFIETACEVKAGKGQQGADVIGRCRIKTKLLKKSLRERGHVFCGRRKSAKGTPTNDVDFRSRPAEDVTILSLRFRK